MEFHTTKTILQIRDKITASQSLEKAPSSLSNSSIHKWVGSIRLAGQQLGKQRYPILVVTDVKAAPHVNHCETVRPKCGHDHGLDQINLFGCPRTGNFRWRKTNYVRRVLVKCDIEINAPYIEGSTNNIREVGALAEHFA